MSSPLAPPAPVAVAAAGRSRTERGWYLFFQMALLFAALLWMPFGARDAAGVSNVLPALRPTSPAAVRTERVEDETAAAPPVRLLASVAVLVVGIVRLAVRRGGRCRPLPVAPPRAAPLVVRHGRAPPLLG